MVLSMLMLTSESITIVASIALGAATMLLSLAVKAIVNGNSFRRSNSARGYELFRMFFLGPDLALLALALFVSSQALRSLLNGYKISTNFGDNFGTYFWISVIAVFGLLFLSVFCWLPHDDNERCFPSDEGQEERQERDGSKTTVKVYEVSILRAMKRRSGILVLGVGNLFGIISILAYAYFIVRAFSPAAP